MIRFLLVVFLSITATFAAKITDPGTVLVPGGYSSFATFLINSPSMKDPTFILKGDEKQSLPDDSTYNLYYTQRSKLRDYTENLWGFCDGKSVFISVGRGAVMTQKYRMLSVRKFYSYYSEPFNTPSTATGGRMSDADIISMNFYVIDMKSGKKASLTKPALREILRLEDTRLYQEFLADSRSEDRIIQYLELLNQRLSEKL